MAAKEENDSEEEINSYELLRVLFEIVSSSIVSVLAGMAVWQEDQEGEEESSYGSWRLGVLVVVAVELLYCVTLVIASMSLMFEN